MSDRPVIAAFRPPGERATKAIEQIESMGCEPMLDPMIQPEPTGTHPREDAAITIFTSTTVTDLPVIESWSADGTMVAAIGPKTAAALESLDIEVDIVPQRFTSAGLVDELGDRVEGKRVEVARSDHGSDELIDGLEAKGAYVHETVLYRLVRPPDAGSSIEAVIEGEIDALAFTSSLTVKHFLELADEEDRTGELMAALEGVIVGAIGPPTAETATSLGLQVDHIASEATFESLIEELTAELGAATRSA